jgi:hypothetical protein
MKRFILLIFIIMLWGCEEEKTSVPQIIDWGTIQLDSAFPDIILPATVITIRGSVFPDESFGLIRVHIEGVFQSEGDSFNIDETELAKWINSGELNIQITPDLFQRIAGGELQSGSLSARLWVEAISTRSGNIYKSNELSVNVRFETSLTPRLYSIQNNIVTHLETPIPFDGDRMLIGNEEGETTGILNGCFLPTGTAGTCELNGIQIENRSIPVIGVSEINREGGYIVLPANVLGVLPGTFEGTFNLRNYFDQTSFIDSDSISFSFDTVEVEIERVDTLSTSLGGFIKILGKGFAPHSLECNTTLNFSGDFIDQNSSATPIDIILVPEVVSGEEVQYVLEEDRDIGSIIDLRKAYGTLTGDISPVVCCGADCQNGVSIAFNVEILPVKQVVYLAFQDSYVSSLARFGLGGAELLIRQRVLDVINEIYAGIHVDIRTEQIMDYALFSHVEIHGFDPNGLNLMGYDNTVGKDVGNLRLFDTIGGVNSHTQEDGYPGYGGVFLESFFGFSKHPPEGITMSPISSPAFDHIFDPFRPDKGGESVTASELLNLPVIVDGIECLEENRSRSKEISCAIYVLGNLLGGTLAHELGHSFGLAEPVSLDIFHNLGEKEYRLMDSGDKRPFEERTGLENVKLEMFCISAYEYLLTIMAHPTQNDPYDSRPDC